MARMTREDARRATLTRQQARKAKAVRVTSALDFDQLAREIHAEQRVAEVTR